MYQYTDSDSEDKYTPSTTPSPFAIPSPDEFSAIASRRTSNCTPENMAMLRLAVEQYRKLPILVDETTCTGKTYIITGGNSGLGLETARHLVDALAAVVVLGVRNLEAGKLAQQDIERSTSRKGVVQVNIYPSANSDVPFAQRTYHPETGLAR